MKRTINRLPTTAALLGGLWLYALAAHAQNATWDTAPSTSNFNTPTNWTPVAEAEPIGPTGTAAFGPSNITSLTFSVDGFGVNTLHFNANAPLYSFSTDVEVNLNGTGIENLSPNRPHFTCLPISDGGLIFNGSAKAGDLVITNDNLLNFFGTSSADHATITTETVNGQAFASGGTAFFENSRAGNATLITNFFGATDFLDQSTAENANIIVNDGGEVRFDAQSSGGQAAITVNQGGAVDISSLTTSGTTAGSIEGDGDIFLGSKNLTVGGNNTDTVFSGTIQDGRSPHGFTSDQPLTGGSLTKVGTGRLFLAGLNTYTGGTTFEGGIVAVEGNGHLGSGPLTFKGGTLEDVTGGNLLENADIEIDSAGGDFIADIATTSTFGGTISGTGGLIKDGPGTLTILGDNSFSGGVTILNGTLVVGNPTRSGTVGNLTGSGTSTALGTGNVLVGPGTLRTTSFQTGVPLTIQVGGNYTQTANGTLALGIGGLAPNQYDRVVVAGAANLNGTLQVFSLPGPNGFPFHPSPGDEFAVFRNNGTRSGDFTLDDSQFNNAKIPGGLRPIAVELVAPNGVDLVYLKGPAPPGTKPPIIDVPPVNPEAPIPEEDVVQLLDPTAEQLTALFEIPFSGANIQRFNLDDRMTQIQRGLAGFVSPPPPAPPPVTGKEALGKETAGKAPPPPPPAPAPRWGVWANGWGDFVNIDDTSTAKGYRFTTGGMSAGIDYRITDHFAVGLFGGYSHTWTDFRPGNADVDTGRGGLYATYFNPTGWWVNVGAWGGYNSYSTSRQALLGLANGSTDGYEVSTFGDAGYNIYCGNLTFGPIVSMQYTTAHISGFTEHGSLVPLEIHADSEDSLRTDLGAQASYNWHLGKIGVIPGLKLAWQHEFKYSNLPLTASAPALGGATANFSGPNLGHDSLLINANVGIQPTSRISITIGYDGQVARDHYSSHTVTGTFSFSF